MGYRTFLCIIVLMLAIPSAASAAETSQNSVPPNGAGQSRCYLGSEGSLSFRCSEIDKVRAEVNKAVAEKEAELNEKDDEDDENAAWAILAVVCVALVFFLFLMIFSL